MRRTYGYAAMIYPVESCKAEPQSGIQPGRDAVQRSRWTFYEAINLDGHVKSRKCSLSVIPAKAGIQCFQTLIKPLGPVFQRGDDFLRSHQPSLQGKCVDHDDSHSKIYQGVFSGIYLDIFPSVALQSLIRSLGPSST